MSVVATDRKTIAADGRVNYGGTYLSVQKLFIEPGVAIGICGDLTQGLIFLDWWRAGADKEDPPNFDLERSFEALVLHKSGLIEYWDSDLQPIVVLDEFVAYGSGREPALMAMHLGKTPKEAVEGVCRLSSLCGLPVTSLSIHDIPDAQDKTVSGQDDPEDVVRKHLTGYNPMIDSPADKARELVEDLRGRGLLDGY